MSGGVVGMDLRSALLGAQKTSGAKNSKLMGLAADRKTLRVPRGLRRTLAKAQAEYLAGHRAHFRERWGL